MKRTFYWHVHHDVLVEELTEPIENRIEYIKKHKPKHEIETRLRLLKPASYVQPAWEKYEKIKKQAWMKFRKTVEPARTECEIIIKQVLKECERMKKEECEIIIKQALDECARIEGDARTEYDRIEKQARIEYEKTIEKIHKEECGCTEWNGKEIIFKCSTGHDVTKKDKDRLLKSNRWMINVRCRRCGEKIVLQKDLTIEDLLLYRGLGDQK
jgi:hypothetical protein